MKRNLSVFVLSIVFISTMLAMAGCSTTSSVVTGTPREPINPEDVKIFRTEPESFEEIGIVEANSKGSMAFSEQAKVDATIERLKKQAAKLGANGIIIAEIASAHGGSFSVGLGGGSYGGSSGASVGGGTSVGSTYKIISGIAIHVSE